MARKLAAGNWKMNGTVEQIPALAEIAGLVPEGEQIAAVHADIRARLALIEGVSAGDVPLLYGGSVKPENAAAIFATPHVDGALVGGASLSAADFGPIIDALAAA